MLIWQMSSKQFIVSLYVVVCVVSLAYSFSSRKQYGSCGGCGTGEVYDHAKCFKEDTNFRTTASSPVPFPQGPVSSTTP